MRHIATATEARLELFQNQEDLAVIPAWFAGRLTCFASEILKHEAEALFSLGSIGNEAPRADGFIGTEFRLKTREGDHSGRNRCNGSDVADRSKSDGIAIVADMDLQHARLVVVVVLRYWSDAKAKPIMKSRYIQVVIISSTVENETAGIPLSLQTE